MDVDMLISAVFRRPCIWDKRRKDHANRIVLDNAWREISQEMNVEVNKNSLTYKFKKWCYYKSYFPELGLRRDDIIMQTSPMAPLMEEALRRIPKEELDARIFRIMRANQLSMQKTVLPKDQWTDFDTDYDYLQPYLDQVKIEFDERKKLDNE